MSISPEHDDGITRAQVQLVSGEQMFVLGEVEARWWNASRDSYLEQTRFTDTTDLRDLDRLLVLELMVFRWSQQLSAGHDYIGFSIDEDQVRKNIREYSQEVSKVKEAMGLTKKARDDAANSGDFSNWIADLKTRARAFGIHRENQLKNALVLMNELSAIISTFDRSDDEERAKLGFETEHEILEWIRKTMLPEYQAVDAHFRTHEQSLWVRKI